jgi:hypothetical protein
LRRGIEGAFGCAATGALLVGLIVEIVEVAQWIDNPSLKKRKKIFGLPNKPSATGELVVRIKRLRPLTMGQAVEMTHGAVDSSV